MVPTVYLISGANRGIGFSMVQHLVARENVVVFAGARDPTKATTLNELATQHKGKLYVLKLTSADETDNRAAIEEIKRIVGRLDVVIANAGIASDNKIVTEASQENMLTHFTVNVLGPMVLFQATYALLKASTSTPKFVPVSTTIGSITAGPPFPALHAEYGTSKAALNWMTRKLWAENEWLVAFPICPGPVDTDMGRDVNLTPAALAVLEKLGAHMQTPEESSRLVLQQIGAATRETGFINQDGKPIPW